MASRTGFKHKASSLLSLEEDAELGGGFVLCPQSSAGTAREAFSHSLTPGSGFWGSAFPVTLLCRDWLCPRVM